MKILPPGKRHKWFEYPVFENLPKEWQIKPDTPIAIDEVKTAVCYAGDIVRDFFELYWIKKIEYDKLQVQVLSIEDRSKIQTFYADALAIVPQSVVPTKKRVLLLEDNDLLDLQKKKKEARKESRKIKVKVIPIPQQTESDPKGEIAYP